MKEHPILFSSEMVRAILNGRKTQTRRIIKPQPVPLYSKGIDRFEYSDGWWWPTSHSGVQAAWRPARYRCPYGVPGNQDWSSGIPPIDGWYIVQELGIVWLRRVLPQDYPGLAVAPGLVWGRDEYDDPEAIEIEGLSIDTIRWKRLGDRLWVRETWGAVSRPGLVACCLEDCEIQYRADLPSGCTDYPGRWPADEARGNPDAPKWRASIHMPRWASRITLDVLKVRVERVQEISEVDIIAEGFPWRGIGAELQMGYQPLGVWFRTLWDSIHAKRGYSWDANPWVFVVDFKRAAEAECEEER